MINQIREKITVIVKYKTLLQKKSVKKLSFFPENQLETYIMEQSWYTWNIFVI